MLTKVLRIDNVVQETSLNRGVVVFCGRQLLIDSGFRDGQCKQSHQNKNGWKEVQFRYSGKSFSFSMFFEFFLASLLAYGACTVCNVKDSGAVGDGIALDDAAFSKCFSECSSIGDTIYVPSGTYLLSPFNMTSNTALYLDHGSTLLATSDFDIWYATNVVAPLPSYEGGERMGPFIGGNYIENVTIYGHGAIDGQGSVWWNADSLPYGRGRLIEPMYCSNFSIIGVTVQNPPFWGVHPYACDNVLIENVTFYAPHDSPNTDGIDPDSCSNVVIRNLTASCGDDAIAIKSGRDALGRAFGRPSRDILIEGGHMGRSRGVNIGSEMSGDVYNVLVRDVVFNNAEFAARIKTARGRGGRVHNITYENLVFENNQIGVSINMNYGSNPASPPLDVATPHVDHIVYRNISGSALGAGVFQGLLESGVKKIILDNINITSITLDDKVGFVCFHADTESIGDVMIPKNC